MRDEDASTKVFCPSQQFSRAGRWRWSGLELNYTSQSPPLSPRTRTKISSHQQPVQRGICLVGGCLRNVYTTAHSSNLLFFSFFFNSVIIYRLCLQIECLLSFSWVRKHFLKKGRSLWVCFESTGICYQWLRGNFCENLFTNWGINNAYTHYIFLSRVSWETQNFSNTSRNNLEVEFDRSGV